jgi:Heterokaryon incompatibility protein (HET)
MREIYSQASCVLAWLGRGTEIGDEAMSLVPPLSLPVGPEMSHIRDMLLDGYASNKCIWEKFGDGLLDCSFWSRLWIVQEISLARQIFLMCGNAILTWEAFTLLLKFSEAAALNIHSSPVLTRIFSAHRCPPPPTV